MEDQSSLQEGAAIRLPDLSLQLGGLMSCKMPVLLDGHEHASYYTQGLSIFHILEITNLMVVLVFVLLWRN